MIPNYKYKPGVYFIATFIITYVFLFVGAYLSFHDDGRELYTLLLLAGMMTPFLVSLFMIFTSKNSDLKKDFINRLINLRLIRPKVLLAFFLIMPLTVLVSIFLSLPFGGSTSQFQIAEQFSFSSGFVPAFLLLILASAFEELGWRGYGFESLQSRYTFFTASIVFSILWSLWHFPLIFFKDMYQYEIFHENIWYAVNFFVSIIPMGVIISWLYIKNGKSVLAVILIHIVINFSQEALQMTQFAKCIESVVVTVVAAIIIILDKEMAFSKEHLTTGVGELPKMTGPLELTE
ncbi:CPBP family intramembrane metalloprotease [Methanosarcina sp. KYL-1]|uniref:MmRce1 family CPBP family CAAX prenyl protease n=1 Tax=Methanosarcina sp. KYL-1 TaxID=2602068 RepID=UPI0021009554|nr:MmRce1 family CPBP family CAAX prenyl protease [Methanosarcina sp. KYL-1]MCQ1536875.1 CPBP family intramembrane metalloprotease [Methanosarcina sp. KYL-1]